MCERKCQSEMLCSFYGLGPGTMSIEIWEKSMCEHSRGGALSTEGVIIKNDEQQQRCQESLW